MHKLAIAAALWTFSSTGRTFSQHKRDRAGQQASVVALLARDSMPQRAKGTVVAPSRTVCMRAADRWLAIYLFMAECQYGMTPRSVSE